MQQFLRLSHHAFLDFIVGENSLTSQLGANTFNCSTFINSSIIVPMTWQFIVLGKLYSKTRRFLSTSLCSFMNKIIIIHYQSLSLQRRAERFTVKERKRGRESHKRRWLLLLFVFFLFCICFHFTEEMSWWASFDHQQHRCIWQHHWWQLVTGDRKEPSALLIIVVGLLLPLCILSMLQGITFILCDFHFTAAISWSSSTVVFLWAILAVR